MCRCRSHDTVTSCGILLCVGGGVGAGSISRAVPCVFFTICLNLCARVAVVDGQVQGYHAVTSCGIRLCVLGFSGAGGVGYAMPSIGITGCLGLCASIAVVNCQVQGINIGAGRAGLAVVVGV